MTPLPDTNRASLVLVSGTNERYAMPLAVTFSSLLINLRSPLPIRIFILSTSLSTQAKDRLSRSVRQGRHDVDLAFVTANSELLSSFSPTKHLTVDALLRLLAPDLLPPDIERALYLDCDLLVLRDVTPLWQFDRGDLPACASIDSTVRVVSNESGLGNYRELGLPPDSPYFNSGVLLMNLRTWREEHIGKACLDYLGGHETHFLDQDAINAVLAGRIGLLPMTWNAMVNNLRYYDRWPEDDLKRALVTDIRNLQRSPAICHFAGGVKPWIPGFQSRFLSRWIWYLWRSRWFNVWEATLWTAKFGVAHLRLLVKRKILAPILGAKPAK